MCDVRILCAPPSFWINEGLKVEGSLTFINYPNNSLLSSYPKASKQSVYLGIYKLLNNKWELIDVKKLNLAPHLISKEMTWEPWRAK